MRRVCPSCWSHNKAIVTGQGGSLTCPLCGSGVKPAPEVLGTLWDWYFKRGRPWNQGNDVTSPPGYEYAGGELKVL